MHANQSSGAHCHEVNPFMFGCRLLFLLIYCEDLKAFKSLIFTFTFKSVDKDLKFTAVARLISPATLFGVVDQTFA